MAASIPPSNQSSVGEESTIPYRQTPGKPGPKRQLQRMIGQGYRVPGNMGVPCVLSFSILSDRPVWLPIPPPGWRQCLVTGCALRASFCRTTAWRNYCWGTWTTSGPPPKKSDARLSGDRRLRLKVPTCRRATVGPDAVE